MSIHPASKSVGSIEGVVTDAKTGEMLVGVTVIVTSAALVNARTAVTDETGRYQITELPPGDYLVTLYYADITVERSGVPVVADKTTPVFLKLNNESVGGSVLRIYDTKPTIWFPNHVDSPPPICAYVHNCPK